MDTRDASDQPMHDRALGGAKQLAARVLDDPAMRKNALAAVLGLGALVVVVFAVLRVTAPSYAYVYTHLEQDDLLAATQILRQEQIPFRVEDTALSVPTAQRYDVRLLLASAGVPSASASAKTESSSPFTSLLEEEEARWRQKEQRLGKTISSMSSVRAATVTLPRPAPRAVFRRDQRPSVASVLVAVAPGRTLAHEQVSAVQHLVAAAAPNLSTDKVSVVDNLGRVLSRDPDSPIEQQRHQREVEGRLVDAVKRILEPVVGVGQVVATVSGEFDMTRRVVDEVAVDADNPALKVRDERLDRALKSGQSSGVAGAAGNTAGADVAKTGGNDVKSSSTKEVFELSKTVKKAQSTAPELKRLSVAVLLPAERPSTDKDKAPADLAWSPEELKKIDELVKRAVGFNEVRGDQVTVRTMPFQPAATDDAPVAAASPIWLRAPGIAAGVGALLVVLMSAAVLFRRRRKAARSQSETVELMAAGGTVAELEAAMQKSTAMARGELDEILETTSEEDEDKPSPEQALLEHARRVTEQNPVRAAHLLRAWLEAEPQAAQESDPLHG